MVKRTLMVIIVVFIAAGAALGPVTATTATPAEETAAFIRATLRGMAHTLPDRPPLDEGESIMPNVRDAWGQPLLLIARTHGLMLCSYGPDGRIKTNDDVIGGIAWKDGRWAFIGCAE